MLHIFERVCHPPHCSLPFTHVDVRDSVTLPVCPVGHDTERVSVRAEHEVVVVVEEVCVVAVEVVVDVVVFPPDDEIVVCGGVLVFRVARRSCNCLICAFS